MLDFSDALGYAPRHVSFNDYVCRPYLGFTTADFLERPARGCARFPAASPRTVFVELIHSSGA